MYLKAFGGGRSVFLLSLLIFAGCVGGQAQKMSPEEIIAKHVASIGKADMIADSKRIMAIGSSEFRRHQPEQTANGRAVLASNGTDMALFSTFNADNYPMERIGLFNNKINIPAVKLGARSPLGAFLRSYDKTLGSRIFGGCIFSTWLLFDMEKTGKFETEGKKKIDNRDAWVLNYTPKGGLTGGSYIKLYFDAENFHHLRTVYRQKEPEGTTPSSGASRGGVQDWNADMANNGFTLTEDFSDVHSDKGLLLPHKYSIAFVIDSSGGTGETDWDFTIEEYRLVRDFPADFFTFNGSSK